MVKSHSAGGYVESWCTTCKMELGHTIVAMVGEIPHTVTCNTCRGKHRFRGAPQKKARARTTAPARKLPKTDISEYLSRLNNAGTAGAKVYSITGNYEKDDIITHSSFGIGFVKDVITRNKIEAIFKDNVKLLLQNK